MCHILYNAFCQAVQVGVTRSEHSSPSQVEFLLKVTLLDKVLNYVRLCQITLTATIMFLSLTFRVYMGTHCLANSSFFDLCYVCTYLLGALSCVDKQLTIKGSMY